MLFKRIFSKLTFWTNQSYKPSMNEQFISFIWKNYYFDSSNLQTKNQQPIQLLDLGKLNHEAGADFQNASIIIDDIRWFGTVEIHLKTSDWFKHNHQKNPNYDNVILHVVYEDDLPKSEIQRSDNSAIPVLELKSRINPLIIEKYALLNNEKVIPCFLQLEKISAQIISDTLDLTLNLRLSRKAEDVRTLLHKTQWDWEETFYQRLAEHFGFKKNNEPFLRLAKSISLKIILKHIDNAKQVESLFLGQAGFLDNLEEVQNDEYAQNLRKEYDFLAHKYELKATKLQRSEWKFLRMRPTNFPTVRVVQLMTLVQGQNIIFTKMIHTESIQEVRKLFAFKLPNYWQKHYDFGKPTSKPTKFGKNSIDNLIINVLCPTLVCYGQEKDQPQFIQKAIKILQEIAPENNKITRLWKGSKILNRNAYESQAILELYNNFCNKKQCLNCIVGNNLLQVDNFFIENYVT